YKSGKENKVADALSQKEDEEKGFLFALSSPYANWFDEVKMEYACNLGLQQLLKQFYD
ncbi:unnamed protein product, partial [Ilex paraguariensis]